MPTNDDWFSLQMNSSPPQQGQSKPTKTGKTTCSLNKKQVIFTFQNNTFYRLNAVVGCVVSNGDSEGTVDIPPLIVEPNDCTSHSVQRGIIMTETMRITTIECIAPLSDSSGLVLHLRSPITLPYRSVSKTTNILITTDWARSTSLYGHMVPILTVDTIAMSQPIPS